jgi:hypothetical protein
VSYVPIQDVLYTAAFTGSLAGLAVNQSDLEDGTVADYANRQAIAGAFAQAIDQAWESTAAPNLIDVFGILEGCQSFWQGRSPSPDDNPDFALASTWMLNAQAVVAFVKGAVLFFQEEGIPIPPWGGSGGGGNGPWKLVNTSNSPFTVSPSDSLAVDLTGGPVLLITPTTAIDAVSFTVLDLFNLGGSSSFVIQDGQGFTLWNPSDPGTYAARVGIVSPNGDPIRYQLFRAQGKWLPC